jgi:hypothetical protein
MIQVGAAQTGASTMRRNEKDLPIDDVLGNLDFAFEFFKAIARAVTDQGGTLEHMRRAVKDRRLQTQIAGLIIPPSTPAGDRLREGEYLVYVGYNMPRDQDTLEAEFGKGRVVDLLWSDAEWKKEPCCADIDETPGERVMLLKQFDREVKSEEAIAEAQRTGYRPATHHEVYAFQKANPDVQYKFPIVGLGSSIPWENHYPCAPGLSARDEWRSFDCVCLNGSPWPAKRRFLCVRK